MLQVILLALVMMCLGLGWMVFRLVAKAEHAHEFDIALKREIYKAGWIAEYEAAWHSAKMNGARTPKPLTSVRQAT